MTCPAPPCVTTARPVTPAPAPQIAPENGCVPINNDVKLYTSCDGCQIDVTPRPLPTRQLTRTIVQGLDPCQTPCPAFGQIFSATESVEVSGLFTRNNCATGSGSTVSHSVTSTETASSTISASDASVLAKAQATATANTILAATGQQYANDNGACL